jgi:hypothetical protein
VRQIDDLRRLHGLLRPRAYLQIGSRRGEPLSLARCGTVLVAPEPQLPPHTLDGKPWLKLYAAESDSFFAQERDDIFEQEPLDLVVIDGARSLPQLARDLRHIERWSNERTCAAVFADSEEYILSQFVHLARQRRSDLRVHLVGGDPDAFLLVWGFDASRPAEDGLVAAADVPPLPSGRRLSARTVPLDRALPPFAFAPNPVAARVAPRGWQASPHDETLLRPGSVGGEQPPQIVFARPLRGPFRVSLEIAAGGMAVLQLRCRVRGAYGEEWRDVLLDIERPGALHHELNRVTLVPPTAGHGFQLELEGALGPDEELPEIELAVVNYWADQVEPEPGAEIHLRRAECWELPASGPSVPFAASRRADHPLPDKVKRTGGRRDAVIFAWWVPPTVDAAKVARYYLGLLAYHHPDSKLFIGINHGSDPAWLPVLQQSGLDITIAPALPHMSVASDAGGFLAALREYERCDEEFDLVWFGHSKGASRDYDYYRSMRLLIDHNFWARRADVERAFADPKIGLYAARTTVASTDPYDRADDDPGWVGELDALRRIYRDRYAPLGLHAYETFFAMRGTVLRRFCDVVGPRFFTTDPKAYGAGRWFFEMAFPSIPSMQGFDPYIPMDVHGTNDPRDDINLTFDAKQTHRLALAELERWRQDPFDFQPRIMHWDNWLWDRLRGLATDDR